MNWRIDTSKNAEKFLSKNELTINEVHDVVVRAIRFLQGEDVNVDIKKLKGVWTGFYRIRVGKIRVIAEFNFEDSVVFIEVLTPYNSTAVYGACFVQRPEAHTRQVDTLS